MSARIGGREENHHSRRSGDALLQRPLSPDAALPGRRRGDFDHAPCAAAAQRGVPAQPAARNQPGLLRAPAAAAQARAGGRGVARRDAPAPDHRRLQAPFRLPHLRRRLQGFAAVGLSAAQEIRNAVRALYPDQLPGPARRIVVGGAGSGDRAEQPHRPDDQRQAAVRRLRDRRREARGLRSALSFSARHEDRRRSALHGARAVRAPRRRHGRVLPRHCA